MKPPNISIYFHSSKTCFVFHSQHFFYGMFTLVGIVYHVENVLLMSMSSISTSRNTFISEQKYTQFYEKVLQRWKLFLLLVGIEIDCFLKSTLISTPMVLQSALKCECKAVIKISSQKLCTVLVVCHFSQIWMHFSVDVSHQIEVLHRNVKKCNEIQMTFHHVGFQLECWESL